MSVDVPIVVHCVYKGCGPQTVGHVHGGGGHVHGGGGHVHGGGGHMHDGGGHMHWVLLYASNHPSLSPSHASYEGTGRSLSLKLIDQLRQQSSVTGVCASSSGGASLAG